MVLGVELRSARLPVLTALPSLLCAFLAILCSAAAILCWAAFIISSWRLDALEDRKFRTCGLADARPSSLRLVGLEDRKFRLGEEPDLFPSKSAAIPRTPKLASLAMAASFWEVTGTPAEEPTAVEVEAETVDSGASFPSMLALWFFSSAAPPPRVVVGDWRTEEDANSMASHDKGERASPFSPRKVTLRPLLLPALLLRLWVLSTLGAAEGV